MYNPYHNITQQVNNLSLDNQNFGSQSGVSMNSSNHYHYPQGQQIADVPHITTVDPQKRYTPRDSYDSQNHHQRPLPSTYNHQTSAYVQNGEPEQRLARSYMEEAAKVNVSTITNPPQTGESGIYRTAAQIRKVETVEPYQPFIPQRSYENSPMFQQNNHLIQQQNVQQNQTGPTTQQPYDYRIHTSQHYQQPQMYQNMPPHEASRSNWEKFPNMNSHEAARSNWEKFPNNDSEQSMNNRPSGNTFPTTSVNKQVQPLDPHKNVVQSRFINQQAGLSSNQYKYEQPVRSVQQLASGTGPGGTFMPPRREQGQPTPASPFSNDPSQTGQGYKQVPLNDRANPQTIPEQQLRANPVVHQKPYDSVSSEKYLHQQQRSNSVDQNSFPTSGSMGQYGPNIYSHSVEDQNVHQYPNPSTATSYYPNQKQPLPGREINPAHGNFNPNNQDSGNNSNINQNMAQNTQNWDMSQGQYHNPSPSVYATQSRQWNINQSNLAQPYPSSSSPYPNEIVQNNQALNRYPNQPDFRSTSQIQAGARQPVSSMDNRTTNSQFQNPASAGERQNYVTNTGQNNKPNTGIDQASSTSSMPSHLYRSSNAFPKVENTQQASPLHHARYNSDNINYKIVPNITQQSARQAQHDTQIDPSMQAQPGPDKNTYLSSNIQPIYPAIYQTSQAGISCPYPNNTISNQPPYHGMNMRMQDPRTNQNITTYQGQGPQQNAEQFHRYQSSNERHLDRQRSGSVDGPRNTHYEPRSPAHKTNQESGNSYQPFTPQNPSNQPPHNIARYPSQEAPTQLRRYPSQEMPAQLRRYPSNDMPTQLQQTSLHSQQFNSNTNQFVSASSSQPGHPMAHPGGISGQPIVIMPGTSATSRPMHAHFEPKLDVMLANMAEKPGPLFAKLRKIVDDVLAIQNEAINFNGRRGDREYILIEEMLTRQLLALDGVPADGIEEIRLTRKSIVRQVQGLISVLERRAKT